MQQQQLSLWCDDWRGNVVRRRRLLEESQMKGRERCEVKQEGDRGTAVSKEVSCFDHFCNCSLSKVCSKGIPPKYERFWRRKLNFALAASSSVFFLPNFAAAFDLAVYLIMSLFLQVQKRLSSEDGKCYENAQSFIFMSGFAVKLVFHLSPVCACFSQSFNESAIIKLSSEMSSRIYIISFKELKGRMIIQMEYF